MKILHIVNSLECGGLEKLVIQLSESLNKRGVESCIICLEGKGELYVEAEDKGIEVHCLNKKYGFDFSLIFRLRKLLKENNIDIVHSHNLGPMVYGALAAKLAWIPAVTTRHNRVPAKMNSFIWNLNKKITTVSHDVKSEILKHNFIFKNKIRVVHNGVDFKKLGESDAQQIRDKKRKELGIYDGCFVIGNVGRLAVNKDQATLLRTFKELLDKGVNSKLVVVGDGPLREQLQKEAKEMKIESKVQFLGFRDDVSDLLYAMDVFVLSSVAEGVPLALLEAMFAKKPVVVTDAGGNAEVVTDGENGFVVQQRDPEGLCEAILKVYSDSKLAIQLGEKGYQRVDRDFTFEKMVNEYEKVYRDILKGVNSK